MDTLNSIDFYEFLPEVMRQPSSLGYARLGERGEKLSAVLHRICGDSDQKEALVEWVCALTPMDVTDVEFVDYLDGVVLAVLVERSGRKTSVRCASDGTLRFLATLAVFLGGGASEDRAVYPGTSPSRMIFFEELETGFHPTRAHLLIDLIESQVRKEGMQVIATTHSPQVVGFLSPETLAHSVLSYRMEDKQSQSLCRICDVPDACRVMRLRDPSALFAAGWFEDAIKFAEEPCES